MNAQDLLNFLLSVQQAGVDLSSLNVTVQYSTYDECAGFIDGETNPSHADISDNELILGPTPYNW